MPGKKRKKHKPSILHRKDGTCFLCMQLNGDWSRKQAVQEHHIYGGPNRTISEAEGMKVYLCLHHHVLGPEAVHNNSRNMLYLRRIGQQVCEKDHTRAEFMEKFGKNYLEDS